jgi:rhamnose utilization protein RhaD (predicted bifunctional aldolase and dehydrogenase)
MSSGAAYPPESLVQLARRLGDPALGLAVLAEGNVSCLESGMIWVTRSGACLGACASRDFVGVDGDRLVRILHKDETTHTDARRLLDDAVVAPETGGQPSTEAWMHAVLLTHTPARFVAHTHPEALLSILALNEADDFARRRLFPDEVVLCGPATLFVPYVMPGIDLAREIDARVQAWRGRLKCLWLRNHGLIALGETAADAFATTLMAAKAARVLLGALSSGKEIQFLQPGEVDALERWEDEATRRRLLASSDVNELS